MNASTSSLVLRRGGGPLAGMGTMLAKESASWWRTRKWWIMALGWLAVLNGTLALNMVAGGMSAFSNYVTMAAILLPIAALTLAQDSMSRERLTGTAAWVLTKPLARPAFVLSKAAANAAGLLATGIALPALAAWIQLAVLRGLPVTIAACAGIAGLLYLNLLFYLALGFMLATFLKGRGMVLAIGLGLDIGWMFFSGTIVRTVPWLVDIMPWVLVQQVGWRAPLAMPLLAGKPLSAMLPIAATTAWTALFLLVALMRFRREEF